MWFLQIIRSFFFIIDSTLFNFIPVIYNILMKLSRSSILSQGNIHEIAGRIQVIMGVFMLFKVIISLITYILNPDDFTDKGKGVAKLGQRIVISLILLVFTPYLFNYAFVLQAKVLESNALATVIFGEQTENGSYLLDAGDRMAFSIMLPFFSPNVSAVGSYGDGSDQKKYDLSTCINLYESSSGADGSYYTFNPECLTQMNVALNHSKTDDIEMVLKNYSKGIEYSNLGLTFRQDIAKKTIGGSEAKDGDAFLIDYNIPLTTVVTVVVLLLLITFCMDIALRSLKLALLQLIAPIPIISYVDPKSGSEGMFKKWYTMCFSTYLSLFVRLLALYFGIYIISMVGKMQVYDVVNNSIINDPIIFIFIIIGVLMFAKQLPKILEGLGIKLDGDSKFQLNPFKKFEDEAVGGKRILQTGRGAIATVGAAAAAGGANAISSASRIKSAIANGEGIKGVSKEIGRGFLNTTAGILGGARRGVVGTIQGKKFGEVFTNSYSGAVQARILRDQKSDAGLKWHDTIVPSIQKTLGIDTKGKVSKKVEEDIKKYKTTFESAKSLVSNDEESSLLRNSDGSIMSYKDVSKLLERLKAAPPQQFQGETSDAYENRIKAYNARVKALEDTLNDRTNAVLSGSKIKTKDSHGVLVDNASANSAISDYKITLDRTRESINKNGSSVVHDFVPIDSAKSYTDQYKAMDSANSHLNASSDTYKAQTADQYSKGAGPLANSGNK